MALKKYICWITASYLLQVDLPILSTLNSLYDIDWYYWGKKDSEGGRMAQQYALKNGIKIIYIESPFMLSPLAYFFCRNTIKSLIRKNYDLYYFDITTFPWLLFCIKQFISKEKVIIAMHHGKIHSGMRLKVLYRPFLKYLNKQPFYLQYFSKTQADAFRGKDSSKKYIIPLALNDFGVSDTMGDSDKIVFTAFGNIIESKNLPLLIEAGNRLWVKYYNRFVIRIVGRGKFWKKIAFLIKYPDAFEIDIRRIADNEIPNLFTSSHYIMFPYKAVTQSGPLRIAYGYNIPVIASDLDGFKESIEEDITGLLFKSENVESLVEVMEKAIENHPELYVNLKTTQAEYIMENYSNDRVCMQYINMLDQILKK